MNKSLLIAAGFILAVNSSACAAETSDATQSAQQQRSNNELVTPISAAATTVAANSLMAPDEAWRDLDPENTLYVDTDYGRIIVELYPEIAPIHVERIKTLTRQSFYDMINFHRVIEDFMNQTGDPKGDGTGDSSLPDIQAEFTFRRGDNMPVTLFSMRPKDVRNPRAGQVDVGFYKALPVATEPIGQSILTKDGKVKAYGLHCKGVTSMARTGDPNSANSQFFLMRAIAPHLDAQYSIWGSTVYGREQLTMFKVGSKSDDDSFVPDKMNKVRIAADVPESDRVNLQVLRTNSPAFKAYLKKYKKPDGNYEDICDVEIPTRLKP